MKFSTQHSPTMNSETQRIRNKIATFSLHVSLPTVRKALGVLEGEHHSRLRSGNDDMVDIRQYTPEDEARLIDWHASARLAQPMIVQREHESNTRACLILDTSTSMYAPCENQERVLDVAANALRMVAAMSLKRSDDIDIILSNSATITRIPLHGSYARFDGTLTRTLRKINTETFTSHNLEQALRWVHRSGNKTGLVMIATQAQAINNTVLRQIRSIAATHPVLVALVSAVNPFDTSQRLRYSHPKATIPAFLRTKRNQQAVESHRKAVEATLEHTLTRSGARLIACTSSSQMFDNMIALISTSQTWHTASSLANRHSRPIVLGEIR